MKHTALLPLFALLLSGCLDFEISTQVHADASLTRTIAVTGDSTEIYKGTYPLRIDDRWKRSYDTTANGKHVMIAQQLFPNIEAMNASLHDSAGILLHITASLEKSFDWFFTRYAYSETWHHYDPYGNIPLAQYLSDEEMELARAHVFTDAPFESTVDSLALEGAEQRFNEWRLRNMFESYYSIFLVGARTVNHPDLLPANIEMKKEALFEAGAEMLEQGDLEKSADAFAAVLQTEKAREALMSNAVAMERFSAKHSMMDDVWKHNYENRISLPGILQETNAPAIEGNTAVWNEFINLCYIEDVTMTAESRTLNWWMVILLAAVILLLLLSLSLTMLRRRKNRFPSDQ